MRWDRRFATRWPVVAALVALSGCETPAEIWVEDAGPARTAAPRSTATPALDPAQVAKLVNPKGEAPYAGPTGKVTGLVRWVGEAPPPSGLAFPKGKCPDAESAYGKKARVSPSGGVADALVAVTGYAGFVPAHGEAAKLTLHGCAPNRRTVAMTVGQRLEVANLDPLESYMPFLENAPTSAVLVAIPRGEPVRLYPHKLGRFQLKDQLPKPFLAVDVYVLKYATHDVSDLEGRFTVERVPVGKVKVNAFLPSLDLVEEKEIEVKEGENTVDFALEWKGEADAGAPSDAGAADAGKGDAGKAAADAGMVAADAGGAKPR